MKTSTPINEEEDPPKKKEQAAHFINNLSLDEYVSPRRNDRLKLLSNTPSSHPPSRQTGGDSIPNGYQPPIEAPEQEIKNPSKVKNPCGRINEYTTKKKIKFSGSSAGSPSKNKSDFDTLDNSCNPMSLIPREISPSNRVGYLNAGGCRSFDSIESFVGEEVFDKEGYYRLAVEMENKEIISQLSSGDFTMDSLAENNELIYGPPPLANWIEVTDHRNDARHEPFW